MNREKLTLNFRWITPIVTVITLVGLTYGIFAKPYKWDQTSAKVETLQNDVDGIKTDQKAVNVKIDYMRSDIKEILRRLDK